MIIDPEQAIAKALGKKVARRPVPSATKGIAPEDAIRLAIAGEEGVVQPEVPQEVAVKPESLQELYERGEIDDLLKLI